MFPDIAYAPLDMLRKVKWNFRLCLLIVLVVDVSFPMVIPSLWPYLDSLGVSQKYLGWPVGVFSLGRVIGSPVLAWWAARRSFKESLCLSLLLYIASYVLYILVDTFRFENPLHSLITISASRFVSGFSGGCSTTVMIYTGQVISDQKRSRYIAYTEMVVALTFICGPLIGSALSFLNFTVGPFRVNQFTAPGFFGIISGFITLLLVLLFFRKLPHDRLSRRSKPVVVSPIEQDGDAIRQDLNDSEQRLVKNPNHLQQEEETQVPHQKIFLLILCFANYLRAHGLAVFETVSVPLMQDLYNFDVALNGVVWGIAGVSAVCGSVLVTLLTKGKIIHPTIYWIVCNLGVAAGFAVMLEVGRLTMWRYFLGTALIAFYFSQSFVGLGKHFNKVLGNTEQGAWSRLLMSAGTLARFTGPLWSAYLYEFRNGLNYIFAITGGAQIVVLLCVLIIFKWIRL